MMDSGEYRGCHCSPGLMLVHASASPVVISVDST